MTTLEIPTLPSPALETTFKEDMHSIPGSLGNQSAKIYSTDLTVQEETREYLLACSRNHIVLYNDMLMFLRKNPRSTYKELRTALSAMLATTAYKPNIHQVIHADIYNLSKRAHFRQKLLTDIQYLSVMSWGYSGNKAYAYETDKKLLWVGDCKTPVQLSEPLPVVDSLQKLYLNLSHSGSTDVFKLSVFTTS